MDRITVERVTKAVYEDLQNESWEKFVTEYRNGTSKYRNDASMSPDDWRQLISLGLQTVGPRNRVSNVSSLMTARR
jgi:hypothetical protein